MKKMTLFLVIVLLSVLSSCINQEEKNIEPEQLDKVITLNSISKKWGYAGEYITISGENFPEKKYIEIYLGTILIEDVSVSTNGKEITIHLPHNVNKYETLNIKFHSSMYVNIHYNLPKPIQLGVIDKKVGEWQVFNYAPSDFTYNTPAKVFSNRIFVPGTNTGIHFTEDEGLSWKYWSSYGAISEGDFIVNDSLEGYASRIGEALWYISKKGDFINKQDVFAPKIGIPMIAMSFSKDLKKGVLVRSTGAVFKTNDAENFQQIRNDEENTILNDHQYSNLYETSFVWDSNNIWCGGFDFIKSSHPRKAKILYCNVTNDIWKTYTFAEDYSIIENIVFKSSLEGFCTIYLPKTNQLKIFKTNNGGDSWESLYVLNKSYRRHSNMILADATLYISINNQLYKSTDNGVSWLLEYTTDEYIQSMAYFNSCIYLFTYTKTIKKYFK